MYILFFDEDGSVIGAVNTKANFFYERLNTCFTEHYGATVIIRSRKGETLAQLFEDVKTGQKLDFIISVDNMDIIINCERLWIY